MCESRRWFSQFKKGESLIFLYLFVSFWSQQIGWCLINAGGPSLFSLLFQMLTSSRNILTVTPRNNVLTVTWTSFGLFRVTHRINHHRDTVIPFWCQYSQTGICLLVVFKGVCIRIYTLMVITLLYFVSKINDKLIKPIISWILFLRVTHKKQ